MSTKKKKQQKRRRSKSKNELRWVYLPDEKLLDLRFCDLGVKIEGTPLEGQIQLIYKELEQRNLRFRPHFWLSNEWFSPDGIPGIAIPFYLAHPRLARLEKKQMLEVEGGTHNWCMKILRHEVGHAIENGFGLRRIRARRRMFGKSTEVYPEFYSPKPYSKSYVLHLDSWYAQSHPDEDFAETFAVWLTPDNNWREKYRGWPVLRKLEYMDRLMADLANRRPKNTRKTELDPIERMRKTLRQHYKEKRERYGKQYPNFYDRDLGRLFSSNPEYSKNRSAASFIKGIRRELRAVVSRWTGEYQYTIDRVLEEIMTRCHELELRLAVSEEIAKVEFTVCLTVQTMNYLHSGRHRIAL